MWGSIFHTMNNDGAVGIRWLPLQLSADDPNVLVDTPLPFG